MDKEITDGFLRIFTFMICFLYFYSCRSQLSDALKLPENKQTISIISSTVGLITAIIGMIILTRSKI